MIRVAVLVDGGFYHKRYYNLFHELEDFRHYDASQAARVFKTLTTAHVRNNRDDYLYRIFYYDCWPLDKRAHNPVTSRSVEFGNTEVARFRRAFFEELKRQRKVALRLGEARDHAGWIIKPRKTKELLAGKVGIGDLTEHDVSYDVTQKGVDMKIGLDIAALAYKQLVEKIVLISGDSDFVPAAKVARREGIDFVLDPMWNRVEQGLFEHIDGLRSTVPGAQDFPSTVAELIKGRRPQERN